MGKGLKAALKSQQSRLKEKEKAQKAARAADLKYKKTTTYASSAKSKAREKVLSNQKPTIPFLPSDDILLVGEGNFSFARALAFHPPSGSGLEDLLPQNITATAYDSEEECYVKYPEAKDIVQNLRERGVEVLFNIDATKLDKISGVKGRKWDRVVWNFPHAGAHPLTFHHRQVIEDFAFLQEKESQTRTGTYFLIKYWSWTSSDQLPKCLEMDQYLQSTNLKGNPLKLPMRAKTKAFLTPTT